MTGIMRRSVVSKLNSSRRPRFMSHLGSVKAENIKEVLAMAEAGKIKVVLDKESPFPFTEEGVKAAFTIQEGTHVKGARHAQGKLVVLIDDPDKK